MTAKELLDRLDVVSNDDNEEFAALTRDVMEFLGLSVRQAAHQFDTSLPTIERWMTGKNAPHPIVRPTVFRFFREDIIEKLRAENG